MSWGLVVRGLVAGLVAGLLAGAFAFGVGEPYVDRAIAFEERQTALAGEPPGEAEVSRTAQKGGLFLATALYGVAIGGLFGLAFGAARRRVAQVGDAALAVALAGILFVGVSLTPFLKYPANPPGVGDPDTIGRRTALYLVMIAISLLALLAAVRLSRRVPADWGAWARPFAAAFTFLVIGAAAFVALPAVDEVPAAFPADLLWDFRVSALGTQVAVWLALGAVFAALSERAARAG